MSGAITSRAPARSADCRSSVDGGAMITTLMSGRSWSNALASASASALGHVGPEGDDLDAAAAELTDRVAGVGEHVVAPVAQRAVELAVERVPDALLEVGVGGREHQPAHDVPAHGSVLQIPVAPCRRDCRSVEDRPVGRPS